jgi:transcriptional regulator with XRE-family HTH domain
MQIALSVRPSQDNLNEIAMTINASQLRAARGLIGWSQTQLAEAANIGRATIADFESGKRAPYDRTLEHLQRALESAGVEFIAENGGGPGVRLRKARPAISDEAALPDIPDEADPYDGAPV